MAIAIKYNTGSKTSGCCVRKGNYDIGINPNYTYGPTASTGFWDGYQVPTNGGFVSYQNKASQGPSIYSIASESDIVQYGKNLNLGGTYNTPESVISACSSINTIALVNIDYPELPQINDLVLAIDAGYTASYPWMGANWFDIASNSVITKATFTGGTTWVSGTSNYNYSNSSVRLNGGDQTSWATTPPFASALLNFTIIVWVKIVNSNGYQTEQIVFGQQPRVNNTDENDVNFLIRGNGTSSFQGLVRRNNIDYTADFGSIGIGNWNMLTLTYDGTDLKTYVNSSGLQFTTNGPGVLVSNGLYNLIGGTQNAIPNSGQISEYFDGNINFIGVWDTALSQGDIDGLYNLMSSERNLF